jgi:hypothetical protein
MLGFINVTDSGQIDLTNTPIPTVAKTTIGYKIYRTNDSMTPIYFKVEFGAGGNPLYPLIAITIGTAYINGGTISGLILLSRIELNQNSLDSSTSQVAFGSGDTNRVCFVIFASSAVVPMFFSFERRKDINISDVDTGVLLDWSSTISKNRTLCVPFTGVIPVADVGFHFILTTTSPAAYGNVVPQGLRIPCLGPSEPPGMNMAFCTTGDYGAFAEPTITINSTNVKFKQCGSFLTSLRATTGTSDETQTRLLLRYE